MATKLPVGGFSTGVNSYGIAGKPATYAKSTNLYGGSVPTGQIKTAAPAAQTSGQPAGPAGPTAPSQPSYQDMLSQAFNSSKDALQSIIPTYDADFQNYQDQVNKSIDAASQAKDQQINDTTYRYGDALKQALQTANDLKQKTQSTFSGLGTLDSSAFGDSLLKNEQQTQDNSALLDRNKNSDISNINNTFDTYKNNQTAQINAYQQEINRAKAGVQQAIANNDISKAQELANYTTNLQNNIDNFALNLAQAQAGGTDVIGALKKIDGSGFLNGFGSQLANQYNTGLSKYQIPTNAATGSGYIGPGSSLTDQQKKLLGLTP